MINFPVNEFQKEDHKSYYFVRKFNFNEYIYIYNIFAKEKKNLYFILIINSID